VKAAVVYDSVYGNTEKIARAIGEGLGSPEEVAILLTSQATPDQWAGMKLFIVGSPTQRFRPTTATSNLLKNLPNNSLKGVRVAAFDTRLTIREIEETPILAFFVRIFGYAAAPMAKMLQKKGGELAALPEGFFVEGMEGPLSDGELERAVNWARQIAAGT
jgi:flavodoxin